MPVARWRLVWKHLKIVVADSGRNRQATRGMSRKCVDVRELSRSLGRHYKRRQREFPSYIHRYALISKWTKALRHFPYTMSLHDLSSFHRKLRYIVRTYVRSCIRESLCVFLADLHTRSAFVAANIFTSYNTWVKYVKKRWWKKNIWENIEKQNSKMLLNGFFGLIWIIFH